MLDQQRYIIVDIGKTLAKVSLWTADGEMLDRQTRPNERLVVDGILRLDAHGIGSWLVTALAKYASEQVAGIIPVAHGAAVVAIEDDHIAIDPFDYEQKLPDEVLEAYRKIRPAFAETGSPQLPDGLNLGAQLFWMEQRYPDAMRTSKLMPWAQYWAWVFSGAAFSEVTSLGCHTDLWNHGGGFSELAEAKGWDDQFAPLANAASTAATLRPELAKRTGLSPSIPILVGLHDSNAALLAARGFETFDGKDATVLSTGTWFIAMRMVKQGSSVNQLSEQRDCLFNIDIHGNPVPSARFMGGREIETIIEFDTRQVDIKPDQPKLIDAVPSVLSSEAMLLPTLAPGCGPFPSNVGQWSNEPKEAFERRAAACLYAALVTNSSLELIGTKDNLLVEGRFAEAEVYVRALASLRPDLNIYVANAHNDVALGALRLLHPELRARGSLVRVRPLECNLSPYSHVWRNHVGIAA